MKTILMTLMTLILSVALSSGFAMKGKVKFFNASKGYGFITPSDGGNDVFVHTKAVGEAGIDRLTEGQRVEFEIEDMRKGPEAVNVVPK